MKLAQAASWYLRWRSRLKWILVGVAIGILFGLLPLPLWAAPACQALPDAACSDVTVEDYCFGSVGCSWTGSACTGTLNVSGYNAYAATYCSSEEACASTCGDGLGGLGTWYDAATGEAELGTSTAVTQLNGINVGIAFGLFLATFVLLYKITI